MKYDKRKPRKPERAVVVKLPETMIGYLDRRSGGQRSRGSVVRDIISAAIANDRSEQLFIATSKEDTSEKT